jgi:hypothetical protein
MQKESGSPMETRGSAAAATARPTRLQPQLPNQSCFCYWKITNNLLTRNSGVLLKSY